MTPEKRAENLAARHGYDPVGQRQLREDAEAEFRAAEQDAREEAARNCRERAEHLAKSSLKRPEIAAYRDGLKDMAEDIERAISTG